MVFQCFQGVRFTQHGKTKKEKKELQFQIQESPVQIYELPVQNHELGDLKHELQD